VSIVLDAWAVVALLKNEPAGPRVRDAIESDTAYVSSINLGEAYYILAKDFIEDRVADAIHDMRRRLVVETPDFELALAAAHVKVHHELSYADSFCVATALGHRAPLWTADAEILAVGDELSGELEVVDLR
jgi:PIN domain nuclease of toxin-antitoxin system